MLLSVVCRSAARIMQCVAAPGLRAAAVAGHTSALQAGVRRLGALPAKRWVAGELAHHRLAPVRSYGSYASQPVSEIEEVEWEPSLTNSVRVIGTTGRDVDLKTFQWGKAGNMSIAVEMGGRPGQKGEAQWLQVEMTGPLAERVAGSVPKGTQVLVEGRLKVNKWTDKTTGSSRTSVVIQANSIKRVRKGFTAQQQQQQQAAAGQEWQQDPAAQQAYTPAAGAAGGLEAGMPATQEELWMDFFQNTAAWSDYRKGKASGKLSPKYPDFKRAADGKALWVSSRGTPAWVMQQLETNDSSGAMGPPPF